MPDPEDQHDAHEEHEEKIAEGVLEFFGAGGVIEDPGHPTDEPLGGPLSDADAQLP
jgi:hypothetical protein